jgi:Xaa-Pro aminopeptidase
MLYFRPLVYIGFDHDLIDESLLTSEEILWLESYERECQARGRSFKYRD